MNFRWTFGFVLLGGVMFFQGTVLADDWPQWLGPNRDSVWRENGIVERFPTNGLPVCWRTGIGGGYSGPAVAGGRVYVTDRVRAQATGSAAGAQGLSQERVLCLNEADGKVVWQHEYECPYTISYPAGPRVTPLVSQGKVYTLGAQGDLLCLEAASGKVIWSRELSKDYHFKAPMWDSPATHCWTAGA